MSSSERLLKRYGGGDDGDERGRRGQRSPWRRFPIRKGTVVRRFRHRFKSASDEAGTEAGGECDSCAAMECGAVPSRRGGDRKERSAFGPRSPKGFSRRSFMSGVEPTLESIERHRVTASPGAGSPQAARMTPVTGVALIGKRAPGDAEPPVFGQCTKQPMLHAVSNVSGTAILPGLGPFPAPVRQGGSEFVTWPSPVRPARGG